MPLLSRPPTSPRSDNGDNRGTEMRDMRRGVPSYDDAVTVSRDDFNDVGGDGQQQDNDDAGGVGTVDTEEELRALKEAEFLRVPEDGFYRFPEVCCRVCAVCECA